MTCEYCPESPEGTLKAEHGILDDPPLKVEIETKVEVGLETF